MAAPVKPEVTQRAPGHPIPSAAELASQRTQQTSDQPDQSTEGGAPAQPGASVGSPSPKEPSAQDRLIAAQEAALRETNAQLQAAARQNAELTQRLRDFDGRIKRVEHPEVPIEDRNEAFWKNPVGTIQELVQSELKKTVDPLNEFRKEVQGQTAYDRMKANLKTEYTDIWPQIESTVDDFVQKAAAAGNEVTPQLLSVAALTASGAHYRGQLKPSPIPTPAPPAPPTLSASGADIVTPPHLRPSAPPIPVPGNDKPEARPLNENERRLARERGWSDQQYLDWLIVPPEEVVHSRIGRKEVTK